MRFKRSLSGHSYTLLLFVVGFLRRFRVILSGTGRYTVGSIDRSVLRRVMLTVTCLRYCVHMTAIALVYIVLLLLNRPRVTAKDATVKPNVRHPKLLVLIIYHPLKTLLP